ncbi:sigma-E factor negative regulatory protein [Methylophilaceae bacterium]|jgi:DNA-binding PucR family transcriptional regulator|nr:sigma-E factor negative regulatory protein [Methylophilaceae bacterium]
MSENISSIIDNELKGKDLDHGLNELAKNSSALSSYRTYQMISDIMKNDYYDVNSELTDKIMSRIQDEPTQFNNGFMYNNQSTATIDYKKYLLVFVLGLIAAFGISWAVNNFSNSESTSSSDFLASDSISQEIIEDHFSTTTRNPNHFLEAGYQPNI